MKGFTHPSLKLLLTASLLASGAAGAGMLYHIPFDDGASASLANGGSVGGSAVRKWRTTSGLSSGSAITDAALGPVAESFFPTDATGALGPAIMLPNSADKLNIRNGTGAQLTFSTYVKWTPATVRTAYTLAANSYKGLDGWQINLLGTGAIQFRSPDRVAAAQNYSATNLVSTGTWHHVTVTVNEALGTPTRVFVDGIESPMISPRPVGELDTDADAFNTQSVYLGVGSHLEGDDSVEYGGALQGLMDDTAFWDTALSTGKLKALYSGSQELEYTAGDMNKLFELFDVGSGTVMINGVTWSNTAGLVLGEGQTAPTNSAYAVQLDASGGGVAGTFTGVQEVRKGFCFSLLGRPTGSAAYSAGTLWVEIGDYRVGFSEGANYTIEQASYKGLPLLTPSGFYQTVILDTAPPEGEDGFIGSGHTPENVISIVVEAGGETNDISEFVSNGKTVNAYEFTIHRKTRLKSFYYHETRVDVSADGIREAFDYEVIGDTSTLSLMYAFMHCFPNETKPWIAGFSGTTNTVCGEFLDDGTFTFKQDMLWSVIYNPISEVGLVYQYPEMYAGLNGHRNKFWNRAYDNKLYFTANAKRPVGETFSYAVEINAFMAGADDWEQVAESRLRTRYPGQNITNLTWTAP